MTKAPRVSVIIPCYMAAHFVKRSIDSVLAQNRDDLQVLVVNDGSPDTPELRRVLAPYADQIERIEEPHRGLAAARNSGLSAAAGDFIAFLDSDDEWKAGFLDRQLKLLHESGADVVYSDAELFGPSETPGRTVMDDFPSIGTVTPVSLATRKCLVVMSTVVARTASVRAVGGFDETLDFAEDLDLWLRMSIAGSRFLFVRDALARRHVHTNNMSSNAIGMNRSVVDIIERHRAAILLSASDGRLVDRRLRHTKGILHLELARKALAEGNGIRARDELWKAVRCEMTAMRLLGALACTVLPGTTTRLFDLLERRRKPRA